MVPDTNGFLWLATENGLSRFDGNYFFNFNVDNVPGLKSSRMGRVYPNDTAITVETDIEEILTVTGSKVTRVGKEMPGYAYQQYLAKKNDYYPIRGWPDDYAEQFAAIRPVVFPNSNESYFAAYGDTISFVKNGREAYRIIQPDLDLMRLFVCGHQLYYFTSSGQILSWKKDRQVKVSLVGDLLSDSSFNKSGVELLWNLAAHQVFAYTGGNCYQLQQEGEHIRSAVVLRGFDFHETYIKSIYYDVVNSRVFLGSSTKGLYVCTRQQFTSHKSDIPDTRVFYAQAPFGKNEIVTASGLLLDVHGKFSPLPLWFNNKNVLEKFTLARDKQGRYWGREQAMLISVSADFSKVMSKVKMPDAIGQVYVDAGGTLWVGGKYRGLYYLKMTAPGLQLLSAGVEDVTYIKEGQIQGVLWIGTHKGLYRVHQPSGSTDTIKGLEQGNIRSIYVARQGEVWISTYNKGIFLYRNERLTALPLDRQGYMSSTHCIIEDDYGYCWLTTNKGLFCVRRQDALDFTDGKKADLFYYYFGKDQGFNTNEFNGGCEPCALKFENGDISLPSLDGLVHYTPASIQMEMPDKGIFVDWIERDLKLTDAVDNIELPHNFKTFRLHVSSPYFGDPRNLYFNYCLEESDKAGEKKIWLPVNSDRTVILSSLPSGDYRIHIRKLKGFGKDQYIEKVIDIHVAEAFYEKNWFRVLVLIVLICLIVLFYKMRVRHIEDQNKLLELKVFNRTRKLQETMATLQESDEQIRKQSLMHKHLLTAITHDIKTPLRFLLMVNKEESLSGKRQEEEVAAVTYESLYRMHHLVDNLIHYMRTTFQTGAFTQDSVYLLPLVEEKMAIFKPVSDAKGIQLACHIPPEMTIAVNKLLLAVVLHNLLDNAVKYTSHGSVEITVEEMATGVIINISDSGIGMPQAVRDWINRPENDGTGHSHSTGIGLILVKELLPVINATLRAGSRAGGGTMLSLQLHYNG
ncbi:MAG: hypothetical protein J7623_06625 [Chitinophaga sp.]|nr:hypothetical protein [Chitinophaga sp.]